ncbi:SDR family NAD(P)-dependent oxidoreductase [Anaerolineae bacterium CFX9]|nr:SDR family NAD(P)-dependent oxidoreductase [Anaerolineae bacterium CFX9]
MDSKIALVTGASSGIGEATARALQQAGCQVYAGARRLERMAHLRPLGIQPIALDVTDDTSMQQVVHTILDECGRIDVLVNSAGYGSYGAIEDVSLDEAHRQMEVNLFGLARMIQLVLPAMRQQRSGKIVNITSTGGKLALPFGGWYHASKFAVEGLSDALRNEVRQFGVDVIIIEPGGVKTEWGDIARQHMEQALGQSAYLALGEKVLASFSAVSDRNAPPSVIGDLIVRAISARHPRPRYTGGYRANLLILKRFLPDRLFDRLVMSQLK